MARMIFAVSAAALAASSLLPKYPAPLESIVRGSEYYSVR
jgi:hypothetical protein